MEYGSAPTGKRDLIAGRIDMGIEMVSIDRHFSVFRVGKQNVEVPRDNEINDPKNVSDITLRFWVKQAVDQDTREPLTPEIKAAISEYIEAGCIKEGVKYKILKE